MIFINLILFIADGATAGIGLTLLGEEAAAAFSSVLETSLGVIGRRKRQAEVVTDPLITIGIVFQRTPEGRLSRKTIYMYIHL